MIQLNAPCSRRKLWLAAFLLTAAYVLPVALIDEGLGALPEASRQFGREALAEANHHFSNPLERLWLTGFRVTRFDESLGIFAVRVYTLFGFPYAEVEVRPSGPNPALTVVHPRLWWLGRAGD